MGRSADVDLSNLQFAGRRTRAEVASSSSAGTAAQQRDKEVPAGSKRAATTTGLHATAAKKAAAPAAPKSVPEKSEKVSGGQGGQMKEQVAVQADARPQDVASSSSAGTAAQQRDKEVASSSSAGTAAQQRDKEVQYACAVKLARDTLEKLAKSEATAVTLSEQYNALEAKYNALEAKFNRVNVHVPPALVEFFHVVAGDATRCRQEELFLRKYVASAYSRKRKYEYGYTNRVLIAAKKRLRRANSQRAAVNGPPAIEAP